MKIGQKYSLVVTGAVLLVVLLAVLELMVGGVSISLGQMLDSDNSVAHRILTQIRLPRMICAILAGGGLALAGCQMQAIFRNPLADPHILGISSGAALGAALMVSGTVAAAGIASGALLGAVLAGIGIVAVSSRFKGVATLLIFGVLLGFVCSAITTLCQYFSAEESLKLYHSWVAGSFASAGWNGIAIIAAATVVGIILAFSNRRGLDLILFGDEFAAASGANVRAIRFKALLSCCLIAAAVTAFCGPIGFVGIIAPHITKALCGTAVHGRLLGPVMLVGAAITLLADVLSQCFTVPIPVGATIALAGIPVIMWLLLGKRLW